MRWRNRRPTGRSSRSNPPFPTNSEGLLPEPAMYPAYIRGLAYLAQKNGPAAAAEFQKFLDHPGIVQNFLLGSLAHLQLARAYAISGDTAKAKSCLPGFPHPLERRRPRHPHPERSQGGVREAAITSSCTCGCGPCFHHELARARHSKKQTRPSIIHSRHSESSL